jgi:hypothetical protein
MNKFGRNYLLTFQNDVGTLLSTVTLPLTVEFDITRNTLASANVCQIRLYNLSKQLRNLIRHNRNDYGNYKSVLLQAGYGSLIGLPIIFSGNITAAWSMREGVNFITQIECYDGGYAISNGATNITFPAGTAQQTVIETLAASLPNVTTGMIGTFPGTLSRAATYSGNTADILRGLTGGAFFIDKQVVNALGTTAVIPSVGPQLVINSQSGLLGTPMLENGIVHFDILFEPTLQVGTQITLASSTEIGFNGDYKVTAVKHRGMISSAVCGTVVTTGEFYLLPPGTPSEAG